MRTATVRLVGAFALVSGLLLALADLTPALFGRSHPAAVLSRAALAPTCHQQAERSHVLREAELASCARCNGLHAAGALGGLLVLLLPAAAAALLPAPRRLALLGVTPLLLDVVAGLGLDSWDHPWLRSATGLLAGCALLLTLRSPRT